MPYECKYSSYFTVRLSYHNLCSQAFTRGHLKHSTWIIQKGTAYNIVIDLI